MTALSPQVSDGSDGAVGWLQNARWDLSRIMLIARREILDMFRDWRIIAPVIILTLVFPAIANWGAGRMVRWVQGYGADIVGSRLVPFLLMIVGFFPISFSLIIALESFVGEKERRSLEPLLSTPLTNVQLYVGKMISSVVPPLTGSLLGITVYLIGVYLNVDWRPVPVLLVQILLLTVMQALVMVAGAVIVSSQTTSVRAANLLASFIIIPMAFLIQIEALIMFWGRYGVLWWILLGLAIITAVLVRMGVGSFNREELLGREIDELNLFRTVKRVARLTLARRDAGPRRSPWGWYRDEVLAAVWRVRGGLVLIALAMAAGYFIGVRYADIFVIPPEMFVVEDWYERFTSILVQTGFHGVGGVLRVLMQNIRVLLLASALGAFTLGIFAILVLMIPTGLIGFLSVQMQTAGMPPEILWAAVLPHSLIELPAAVLVGAAVVRLGASIISPPPPGKTVGEGWIEALADALRLSIGLALPLLIIAAFVEIYVTPAVIGMVAGG
jgi:uncharacterized membrane protein SpoIIM required for sporulation/ABC-type transport system involved in multi-copper enzyme maturation permease subunit